MTTTASIGNHAKFTARPVDRERIRRFYQDVLGCAITKRSNEVDFFMLGGDFFIAAIYEDRVLPEEEQVKAIWLELRSDYPAALSAEIRAFGVTELDTWEKDRLYFQAPGGQVFRVVGADEDLSRFESCDGPAGSSTSADERHRSASAMSSRPAPTSLHQQQDSRRNNGELPGRLEAQNRGPRKP